MLPRTRNKRFKSLARTSSTACRRRNSPRRSVIYLSFDIPPARNLPLQLHWYIGMLFASNISGQILFRPAIPRAEQSFVCSFCVLWNTLPCTPAPLFQIMFGRFALTCNFTCKPIPASMLSAGRSLTSEFVFSLRTPVLGNALTANTRATHKALL